MRKVECWLRNLLTLKGGSDGQLLASFVNHAEFIQAFIPIPSDAVTKLKASVASISKDHSIAFLDLEDLRW